MDIAFSIDDNYVNHLIVAVYSLLLHNKQETVRIHVLSSDITPASKAAIDRLTSLNKKAEITYHTVDPQAFNFSITMNYITQVTYYRLMLAELLPDVEKVLYLDADILVTGDVKEVFQTPLEQSYAAGVPDIYLDKDEPYKQSIGLGAATYFNAGILMLNLAKIRRDGMTAKLLAAAATKTHQYQDQDAINVVFGSKTSRLAPRFNYQIKDTVYKDLPDDERTILHYSGSKKPWNRDRPYDAFSVVYDDYKLRAAQYVNSRNKQVKYGLLKYSTDNVGDTVQGIAARKFLPQVDYYFERDNMDATKTRPGDTVKVIMNGWWGDGPENWPPLDQNLDVLLTSMYAEDRIQKEFKKPRSKAFLNFFGPVGARSRGTEKFLKDNGVEAFFSGCLTLTLNADKRVKKQDYVLAVDVSDAVYEQMCQQTDRKVLRIGVLRKQTTDENEQSRLAELYLYLYQAAHAVVTTRLHTMLPCLALGTPVLFINDILKDDDVRFSGLAELAHNLQAKDYVAHPAKFDINKPPANKKDYLSIRSSLEKQCADFTGHMSQDGFLTEPLPDMIMDPDFLQAVVGGTSEAGYLKEQKSKLETMLQHKDNHVKELVAELEVQKREYDELVSSLSWRVTRPLRSVNSKTGRQKDKD